MWRPGCQTKQGCKMCQRHHVIWFQDLPDHVILIQHITDQSRCFHSPYYWKHKITKCGMFPMICLRNCNSWTIAYPTHFPEVKQTDSSVVPKKRSRSKPLKRMNPATVAHPIASAWCSLTRTRASVIVPWMKMRPDRNFRTIVREKCILGYK